MKIIKNIIKNIKYLIQKIRENLVYLSKKIVLPGFEGLPLYDVIDFFFKGIKQSSLISRANALSFTFLLGIFPAIIFFFTLIPYIPISNLHETIMNTLQSAIPEHTYKTVKRHNKRHS